MNLEPKVVKTSSNKLIYIYDNVFNFQQRTKFLKFIKSSFYNVNTRGGLYEEVSIGLDSIFNNEDLSIMGFCDTSEFCLFEERHEFKKRNIKQIRSNLLTCFERSEAHIDNTGMTLVYYPNLKWDMFWGGHTTFLSEDLSNIEHISVYKPNRVIVFDGTIPHSISPISVACREYRFTFAIQYGDIEKND